MTQDEAFAILAGRIQMGSVWEFFYGDARNGWYWLVSENQGHATLWRVGPRGACSPEWRADVLLLDGMRRVAMLGPVRS